MKSIYLVRHATAQPRDPNLSDFDRKLIKKGKKESRKAAERFQKYKILPNIWISSPAPRALETAQIFADILDFPHTEILLESALYDQNDSKSYFELIASLPHHKSSIILFGHDPGISECASALASNVQFDFPKAGIEGFTLLTDSWKKLESNAAYLTLLELPRSSKVTAKILQNNLTDLIYRLNQNILTELSQKMTGKMKRTVKSFSEKISNELLSYRKKKI
jgi:phosphohistidine phosphatase